MQSIDVLFMRDYIDELACIIEKKPWGGFGPNQPIAVETTYERIRKSIESLILERSAQFVALVQNGDSPRRWVLVAIANFADDELQTGKYHHVRGSLNPMSFGNDLPFIFDLVTDELLKMEAINKTEADKQKQDMREVIRQTG